MKEKLQELLTNAYAPYSNYQVASLVETNDNHFYGGVNVENASYGATICAERNAINSAIKQGYRKGDFKALYVMVSADEVAFPCFICRQTINEFFTGEEDLILISKNNETKYKIKDIIVYPFGEENLKWNQDLWASSVDPM